MAAGIASLVKSLGDFPLDPDRGLSWLWSGDGARLLWLSSEAAATLEMNGSGSLAGVSHGQSLESFAQELSGLQPDRQPIRVKQVPVSHGRHADLFTCLCRHVPMADGSGFGLLTVAIGAPPRLPVRPQHEAPPPVADGPTPMEDLAAIAAEPARVVERAPARLVPVPPAQAPVVPSASAPEPAPAWLGQPADQRRPLRFIWQTDAAGRFVHLSRELAEGVGPGSSMILGRRFVEAAADLSIGEAETALRGFESRDTWSASPVLWPVAGSDWGVPVELAGVAISERGAFKGFRGYGIARIERALRRPGSAAAALADDAPAETERTEDRFGPAIGRALAAAPPPPVAAPVAAVPDAREQRPLDPPEATRSEPASPRPVSSDPTPLDEGDESHLTPSERNAFREIARALGRGEAPPEPSQPLPAPAPLSDERPPISPRQMPAWIARRQQARMEAVEPLPAAPEPVDPLREPPPRESPAPVVPFEALQARIDRRIREPASAAVAAALDRLPLAVLVMQQGRPVYANAAFLDLAGQRDLSGFAGRGGADSFFTAEVPEVGHRAANAITVRDARGRDLSVEAQVQATVWDDTPAALMTFRKLEPSAKAAASAAKGLELELLTMKAELNELRFVLDTATDGVLSLDAQGRILAANKSAEALFGFDQNEIAGEPFTILLEPESHPAALDYLNGLRIDGVATIMNDGREVFGRERHGGRIPLFMTLGRMGSAKEPTRFCAVLRDVTIWKKAEAELTDARRAAEDSSANKTDFLARVSHEIRTPMNAIIGFADVMRMETFGPVGHEKYKGYVEDIHASGQHVVSLVNDLLDLSKVAAGKLDLSFGSVDLNQAVATSVSMIQPQANAGKLIVRMQLAPKLPPVVADERSVRQILLNLLSNAAKFTEPGGQVIVTTALTEKGEAAIRVRDTGIGMSAEDLKKAIEPFRQIPGPRSSGGTGLGLPLTKALAEANRANFLISSEAGQGTLAEVIFPPSRVLAE